jgi:hypothetical protein
VSFYLLLKKRWSPCRHADRINSNLHRQSAVGNIVTTAKLIITEVSNGIEPFLAAHGYCATKRSVGRFCKNAFSLDKRITLTISSWSNSSGYHVDHLCEYRIDIHETILNQFLPSRTKLDKKLAPTISTYFLNIVPKAFDWDLITARSVLEIPKVVDNVKNIIAKYSFRFLDRFDTPESIYESYEKSPECWPDADPILRFQILMIKCVVDKDSTTFHHIRNDCEIFCRGRNDGRAMYISRLSNLIHNQYFK